MSYRVEHNVETALNKLAFFSCNGYDYAQTKWYGNS